jgi:hypothetical protein
VIGFGLPVHVLKIDQFWNIGMDINMMTTDASDYMPSTCIKRVQARGCDMFGRPPGGSSYITLHTSQAQKGT